VNGPKIYVKVPHWSKNATSIEADAISEGFLSSVKLYGIK